MKFNILDLLLPRETKFFKFMNQQVQILIESCQVFKDLVINLKNMNEDQIKIKLNTIKELEQKGDEVERMIIDELHQTFITPIDREDIHLIAINIDKSIDILNSISQKIEIYSIRSVPNNVCNFADIILEISGELTKLFTTLENKGDINRYIKSMHELENKADYLFHLSMADLFGSKHNPVEIIKFKEVYEHLENVVDSIDFICKLIRGVVVKRG